MLARFYKFILSSLVDFDIPPEENSILYRFYIIS